MTKINTNFTTKLRDCACNELTASNVGQKVTVCGWLMSKRNHGGIIFADIRDYYGMVQIAIDTHGKKSLQTLAHNINKTNIESVVFCFWYCE